MVAEAQRHAEEDEERHQAEKLKPEPVSLEERLETLEAEVQKLKAGSV